MLKNTGFFNKPGKNIIKIKTDKKKAFKEEFEGLSAKQLVDKFRGNM